ncbi:MAG: sodium-coupled permease [Bacteroidia bacterium]|nr:sodium-coupled permease [Bacteroidia bacterium]
MHWLDWIVLIGFFIYTLWDGLRHASSQNSLESMVLAGRSIPWWAAGLSVMATQASAVTFISTTGLSFMEDMKFLQVYLGMPIAMVILSVTLVPLYYKMKVYTIYEALENRFGLRMRLITSLIFLISRGATVGFSIAAPAYVLSLLFGIQLSYTIIIMGLTATVYTMFGGIGGVIRTDMKQMVLMLAGLAFCFFWIVNAYPEEVSLTDGLKLAGKLGKLNTIDLNFDVSERYNIWSGLIAATFLMLSYFGADQPQVQRVLTAKSLTDARSSLLMSAIFKIPMQFFILLLGVLLYVFYIYAERPLLFLPENQKDQQVELMYKEEFAQLSKERITWANLCKDGIPDACELFQEKDMAIQKLRKKAIKKMELVSKEDRDDTNYVFPFFILSELPPGLVGLILAAILAAALSSIDSVLNSLATTSVVDWLKRLHVEARSDEYYLNATRWATAMWGILATLAALMFGETEAIIEVVNKLGSFVYGPILGVFLLLWQKRADSNSSFWAFIVGLVVVIFSGGLVMTEAGTHWAWQFPFNDLEEGYKYVVEYLWLNPLGVGIVMGIGLLFGRGNSRQTM